MASFIASLIFGVVAAFASLITQVGLMTIFPDVSADSSIHYIWYVLVPFALIEEVVRFVFLRLTLKDVARKIHLFMVHGLLLGLGFASAEFILHYWQIGNSIFLSWQPFLPAFLHVLLTLLLSIGIYAYWREGLKWKLILAWLSVALFHIFFNLSASASFWIET